MSKCSDLRCCLARVAGGGVRAIRDGEDSSQGVKSGEEMPPQECVKELQIIEVTVRGITGAQLRERARGRRAHPTHT